MKRTDVVNSLRLVATVLSGGTLKPPPNMVKEVYLLVRKTYASWCHTMALTSLGEIAARMAVLKPSEDTAIPAPKLSPAMSKKAKETAKEIADGTVDDFLRRALDRLSSTPTSRVNFDSPEVKKQAAAIVAAKTLNGLDKDTIRLLVLILRSYMTPAAQTAAGSLMVYLSEQQKLDLRKAGLGGTGSDDIEVRKLEEAKEKVESFIAYLQTFEAGSVKGLKKGNRAGQFKVTNAAIKASDVVVPVDLSGLPPNYPTTSPFDTILLRMMPVTKVAGFWAHKERMLCITFNHIAPTKKMFDDDMSANLSTIKHELEHMVQTIIRENLEAKGQNRAAQRAGTPFNRRSIGERDNDYKKNLELLQQKYPEATEQEAYLLSPIEFFPQIQTYVNGFRRLFGYSKGDPEKPVEQRLADWKQATGMGGGDKALKFYLVLRKYDKPRYRRAVSEGWDLLNQQIEEDKE